VSALCSHLSCGSSWATRVESTRHCASTSCEVGRFCPPGTLDRPWPLRARRGVPEISRTKKPFLRFALLSNGLSEDLGPVKLQRISSAQSAVPKPKGDANIQSRLDRRVTVVTEYPTSHTIRGTYLRSRVIGKP
jgi:hypothetical protein